MRNNASLSDFGLTSLFTLFFYNQIINTIFIKTFLIFYLIIYVYYIIILIIFHYNKNSRQCLNAHVIKVVVSSQTYCQYEQGSVR